MLKSGAWVTPKCPGPACPVDRHCPGERSLNFLLLGLLEKTVCKAAQETPTSTCQPASKSHGSVRQQPRCCVALCLLLASFATFFPWQDAEAPITSAGAPAVLASHSGAQTTPENNLQEESFFSSQLLGLPLCSLGFLYLSWRQPHVGDKVLHFTGSRKQRGEGIRIRISLEGIICTV